MFASTCFGVVMLGVVQLVSGCADLDTQACIYMANQTTGFCSDSAMAKTACPKFCKICIPAIQCYNCNSTASDYHLCNTIIPCQVDEVCMRRELRSIVDGHEEFELTCATKSFCDNPWHGTGMMGKRDLTVSCCTTDLCNKPIPTTVSPITAKPATVAATTIKAATTATATTATTSKTTTTRTTTKTTHAIKTTTTAKASGHCTGCCKDFMIAVDESSSIHPSEMKQFLHHVVSNLQIGSTKTLVSLGTFDQQSRTVFNIGDHMTKSSTLAAIDSATFHGGHGDINAGVDYLIHHATTPSGGDRPGYPNILLIITDGTNSQLTHSKEHILHSRADHVISVEIGSTHYSDLASGSNYQIHLHSQSNLHNVDNKVANLVCDEPTSSSHNTHNTQSPFSQWAQLIGK